MRVRKDQRGFTIVELLIAIAILSIVVAAVCGFILVGSRSYATANSDINVQQSAQLSLNQMSDVMIDTTRSVNYVGYDAGGNPTLALKDSEFTFTPEDKSLIMYNGVVEETPSAVPGGTSTKTVDPGNGNKHYHFYWNKASETLYYSQLDVQPGDVDTSAIAFPTFDPADPIGAGWVELATHVTDFSVDLTQVEEKRVVMLALSFLDGKKLYTTSNNVTIRNKIGVNDAEIEPLNRNKKLTITPRDAGVILEPGETYHFSVPKVTGENVADKSVKWSVVSASSSGTYFTDVANGILQVGTDEPAGTIQVMITSNATDETGAPLATSSPITVYIKRVRTVSLSKTADADATNAANQVSVGSEFTISALVEGEKLGVQCNGCTADISHDFDVVNWRVTQGDTFLDIVDAGDCKKDTKYCVKTGTPEGTVIKIAATSELGLPTSRLYPAVDGEITLIVAKSKNPALPLTGDLRYASPDDDLHEDLKFDEDKGPLSTTDPRYVTCIRVVDNTGKQEDKVLLHFTQGGGANIRIVPDMFDLNLNGSYTFYMQVLDVPNDNGVTDSKAEIWDEYINHLSTTSPYGYIGTRYDYRSVRYAKLEKPKITLRYKEVDYTGKQVTFDPLNVYMYSTGGSIISRGNVWPTDFYQIEKNKAAENLTYSIYKEEGGTWKPIYYFDEDSMSYKGDNRLKDSNNAAIAEFNVRGDPFMKMENGNKQELCGSYRFVPGITYDNKNIPGGYEYIGWQGFPECPYSPGATFSLNHEKKYYEFDDSTIYVDITDEFTMDIDHSDFKGQAMFPLPKEMKRSSLFPNINSLDWQTTVGKLTVKAQRDNSWNAEDLTFTYVRYRYIKTENAWEVEPIRQEYRAGMKKIQVHSYGIYKCGEGGKKWECITRGGTTEKEFEITRFEYNNGSYRTEFPLPTDSDFPFKDGTGETRRTLELYDSNMNKANNVPVFTVSCKKNGEEYEIEFRTEEREGGISSHKIKVVSYGIYTWSRSYNQTVWTWEKGNSTSYKTDFEPTLRDLKLADGNTYMMEYPLPTDSGFRFKNSGEIIKCNGEKAYDQVNDSFAEREKKPFENQGIEAKYTVMGGTHTIQFYKKEGGSGHKITIKYYGTYMWSQGQYVWTQTEGNREDITTDLVTNLEGVLINGVPCKMYFPLPSESSFPFKGSVTKIDCTSAHVGYELTDLYGENAKYDLQWGASVKYTHNGNTHRITFVNRWNESQEYGTFECADGGTGWTKVN